MIYRTPGNANHSIERLNNLQLPSTLHPSRGSIQSRSYSHRNSTEYLEILEFSIVMTLQRTSDRISSKSGKRNAQEECPTSHSYFSDGWNLCNEGRSHGYESSGWESIENTEDQNWCISTRGQPEREDNDCWKRGRDDHNVETAQFVGNDAR